MNTSIINQTIARHRPAFFAALADDRMIEVMKASEADAAGAKMRVRGESWRNAQVTDAFSLQGFTAAHEAASGRNRRPRPPPAGTRTAVDLRSVDVEGAQEQIGVGHTELRLLGAVFRKGERETFVTRAISTTSFRWTPILGPAATPMPGSFP